MVPVRTCLPFSFFPKFSFLSQLAASWAFLPLGLGRICDLPSVPGECVY